jgi:D-alanine-D-alanine ligase
MYPMLWEASGLSNRDLVQRLVELAVERHVDLNALASTITHSDQTVVD